MELPFLRFGFEENGDIDRGSKGKEKEGTWTDEERTAQMYARESERRMDLYSDKWEELCVRYGLKDVPHHLRVEDDSSRRIVKHESTASAESTPSRVQDRALKRCRRPQRLTRTSWNLNSSSRRFSL